MADEHPNSEPTRASLADDGLAELTDEFLRRHRAGEQPSVEEYVARHPEWAARILQLFPAVLWMEQSAAAAVLSTPRSCSATECAGMIIGRYKLLELIGEGGFGVVYMAEQQFPVRRKVALKLIKPGMDTRQILGRFEAEQQALAMMDHPNIARILDAGATESGRPYFVMELIKGLPITEYCDQWQFTPRERLELFMRVCHAVQHAHQKGVIHRDLKPSNVLVMQHDTKPVVKVIDFGIAKALGQELTSTTLFTGFAQLIGTPLYMSPEQAGQSSLDVDTRSDVYSLGVLLYELLTGTTPFDRERFKRAADDEMRRIIREEEPPKPSIKLSSSNALQSISAQRRMEPAHLSRFVRGELDWIVMKALDKERSRRYETADAFAMDVHRYLGNEPVCACPPSTAYRFSKFVRRNQRSLLAALLLLLTLLGGLLATISQAMRAERAWQAEARRAQAERQAKIESQRRLKQVEKGTEILAGVLRDLDPIAAELDRLTPRDRLHSRLHTLAEQLRGDASEDPLIVARLQQLLGILLRNSGYLKQAEAVLSESCQIRERSLGARHLDTAASKQDLARVYRDLADYSRAEALYREVLEIRKIRLGAEHASTLDTQYHLAVVCENQGKVDLAEGLFQQILSARAAEPELDHSIRLATKHRLSLLYRTREKYAAAEALCHEVLVSAAASLGDESRLVAAAKANLAELRFCQQEYEAAEALHREVWTLRMAKLGPDHPDTLHSRAYLAKTFWALQKYDLAEQTYREVLAARTSILGRVHPYTLAAQQGLAAVCDSRGDHHNAERFYRDALTTLVRSRGRDDVATQTCQHALARHYWYRQKFDQAIGHFEELISRAQAVRHPSLHVMQTELGSVYSQVGRFEDAIPLLEEVCQRKESPSNLPDIQTTLLTAYARTRQREKACRLAAEMVRAAQAKFSPDSQEFSAFLSFIGELLVQAQAVASAVPFLEESLAVSVESLGSEHTDTIRRRDTLALVYRSLQQPERSIPLLEMSLKARRSQLADHHPEILGRLVTLGAIYCEAGRLSEGLALIVSVREAGHDDPHPAWVRSVLLDAYRQAGKFEEAIALIRERVDDARFEFRDQNEELAKALVENGITFLNGSAYADAERLLLEAYETLKQLDDPSPFGSRANRLQEVRTSLTQLYEAWGKPELAGSWRQR